MRDLDLNLLFALEALLTRRSVSGAADAVGMTQSGMSRALSRLREYLHDPLFVFAGGKLVATPRAESVGQAVCDALALLRAGIAQGSGSEPGTTEQYFTLGMASSVEMLLLPAVLHRLQSEAPRLRVRTAAWTPEHDKQMVNGDLDLVIGPAPGERAGIVSRRIVRDHFVGLIRRGHPNVELEALSFEALCGLTCVLVAPDPKTCEALQVELRRQSVTIRVRYQSSCPSALLGLRAPPDVLTILPGYLASHLCALEGLQVQRVALPVHLPEVNLTLSWPQRSQTDSVHRWLREAFVCAASELTESVPAPVLASCDR